MTGSAGPPRLNRSRPERQFHLSQALTFSLAHLFHDSFTSFLPPLLPLLINRMGLTYSMAGLLVVFLRLPSLLNPVIGLLADRFALRTLVIITPAVTAAAMSLLPLAPSYAVLALLLLVAGLSSACFHVPTPVMIRRVSGDRIGTGMSLFMVGGEAARSLGPLLILAAVSLWGPEGSYRLIALGLAASLVLYLRLRGLPAQPLPAGGGQTGGVRSLMRRLGKLYAILAGLTLSRCLLAAGLTSFLPTYLTARGGSLWLAGAALSVLELAGAVGTLAGGTLSDRIGRRRLLLISGAAYPLFMLLFVFSRGWATFPLLIVLGLFLFATQPVLLTIVQEEGQFAPALANGIYMTLNFVIVSLTTLLIGVLGDHLGLATTYLICALLSFVGVPVTLLLPRDRRQGSFSGPPPR